MLKSAAHLDRILAALGSLQYYLKLNSAQGFISPAAHLEDFCIPLLDAVYGYSLTNANAAKSNTPAIDLIDDNERLGIQVTINDKATKISDTYKTAADLKHNLGAEIGKLLIFFFTAKAPKTPAGVKAVPGITIELLDLTDLITEIRSFPPEKQEQIAALLDHELSSGPSARYIINATNVTVIPGRIETLTIHNH